MTPHVHSAHVPGCYRCDLSSDEVVRDRLSAPHPSPAEQAQIDRFAIFDREQRMARLANDLNREIARIKARTAGAGQRDSDRHRFGVTCDCLGPPYYVCQHWPVIGDEHRGGQR